MYRFFVWPGFAVFLWVIIEILFAMLLCDAIKKGKRAKNFFYYLIHWVPFILFVLYCISCLANPSMVLMMLKIIEEAGCAEITWFMIGVILALIYIIPGVGILKNID